MGCGSSSPKSAYILRADPRPGEAAALDKDVRRMRGSDASVASMPATPDAGSSKRGRKGSRGSAELAMSPEQKNLRKGNRRSLSDLDRAAFDSGSQRAAPGSGRRTRGNNRMTKRGSFATAEASQRAFKRQITDFEVGRCIGKGGYAHVVQALCKKDNTWYALKVIRKRTVNKKSRIEYLMNEKHSLSAVHSPFVVRMHGTFQDANSVYFQLELGAGGELFSRMHKVKRMPEEEAKFYMAELAVALGTLHGAGVMYRDLKPENVVLDHVGHIKLVDFGFAKMVDAAGRCTKKVGTPHYLAPEMLHKSAETDGYTVAIDFWAYGCLMYEMLTGKAAWGRADESPYAIYTRIMQNKLKLPGYLSAQAQSLLRALLNPNPDERISDAADVREHPWFAGVDWDAVEEARLVPPFVPDLKSLHDTKYFDSFSISAERSAGAASGAGAAKPIPEDVLELLAAF